MPRRNDSSEVFDNYNALAEETGLLKESYNTLEQYKNDVDARVGSDSISDIEALYGIKPEMIPGMEYEENLVEIAHPNAVVIAPSYDKINGLVENINERHNIMVNITQKVPVGVHTNPKYAQQELTMELIRLANEMDAKNQDKLYKLADECLTEISNYKFKKKAVAPIAGVGLLGLIPGWGWAAAIVLGGIYLYSHTNDMDEGPLPNCDRAIEALTDLKTNSWWESDVDAEVQKECDKLIKYISVLKSSITKYNHVVEAVQAPRVLGELENLDRLKEIAAQKDMVKKAVDDFSGRVAEIKPLIEMAITNFDSGVYQNMHTKPSAGAKLTSWLGEALHGNHGLIANDFLSAKHALVPLEASLEELTKVIGSDLPAVQAKAQAQIAAAHNTGDPANIQSDKKQYEDVAHKELSDDQFNDFEKLMQGYQTPQ